MLDTALLTSRSLRSIPRVPERLLDVTIQPIIFILLFLYVFGSAIHVVGISYKDYLFPGIIGQSLAFGIIGAGVATSNDMTEGVVDRFRSMPISRLSIISGQVMGQFCEALLGMVDHDRRRPGARLGSAPDPRPRNRATRVDDARDLRVHLDGRAVRDARALARRNAGNGLHHHPAADLHGRHVRADRRPRRRAACDRPVGPDLGPGRDRQRTDPGISILAAPGSSNTREIAMALWCVLLLAVIVPLALRRFNRTLAS